MRDFLHAQWVDDDQQAPTRTSMPERADLDQELRARWQRTGLKHVTGPVYSTSVQGTERSWKIEGKRVHMEVRAVGCLLGECENVDNTHQ